MSPGGAEESPIAAPAPGDSLPAEAWAVALAGLPAMGPARLRALLGAWDPATAWQRVLAGTAHGEAVVAAACRPDPAAAARAWAEGARRADPERAWWVHQQAGVAVHVLGGASYPAALAADPEAPAVLFTRGRVQGLGSGRSVAIIGTRRASSYGRAVARELGRGLCEAGVTVVSGLALGIDGAAHEGALSVDAAGSHAAPPTVGVVGSGLDVTYPRAHRGLWERIAAEGLLVGEAPLGTPPEAWRFPVRNRVIAALVGAVVVVESRYRGGSVHTVEAAAARGRPVLAVPGPVRSPTSELPNGLLADGCHPARDTLDVLVALELAEPVATRRRSDPSRRGPAPEGAGPIPPPPLGAPGEAVLDAMGWEPAGFEEVVVRARMGPAEVGVALAHLERDGWAECRAGRWERLR